MILYKAKWWQKLLIMLLVVTVISVIVWLVLVAIVLALLMIAKQSESYGSILSSRYGLIGLAVCFIGISIGATVLYVRGRRQFKQSPIAHEPNWLKQQEFRKRVLLSADKLSIPITSFTFGYEHEPRGFFRGNQETFTHILAINKKLITTKMSPDIMVKDNQTFIGSKSLDLLTGGSIFVIGSPGSGKSINIILPSILASLEDPAKPSLVVTDPKNELYSSSAAFALKNGYRVIKFDLSKPESSDHWNFLSEVYELYHTNYLCNWFKWFQLDKKTNGGKTATAEQHTALTAFKTNIAKAKSQINRLIERYSVFTSSVTGGHNVEFQKKGRALAGMFMLLPLDLGISKQDYTPYTCAYNADVLNFELPIIIEQLPPWALCKPLMGDLKSVSISTTASQNFLQNARGNLSIFLDQDVRDLTSDSTFALNDLITEPTIFYITMPTEEINAESETKESSTKISRLASLLCSSLYTNTSNYLTTNGKEYLDRPQLWLIDELPQLGRLDFLEPIYSLGRGRNIFALGAIQSINQMDRIYSEKGRKAIFTSAAALIVTQIGNDLDTARYLSDLSGWIRLTKKTKNYSDVGEHKGYSEHEQKERAVEEVEFTSNQRFGDFFVLLQSQPPYKMHTENFVKSNTWRKIVAQMAGMEEPKRKYTPQIESVNLYTDVMPEISKRFWMYRIKDRLNDSKNYKIQYDELISLGLTPLNKAESELVNEFINDNGWLPGFGIEEFIEPDLIQTFITKLSALEHWKENIDTVSKKTNSQKITKSSDSKKSKKSIAKVKNNKYVKSKDPDKHKKQLAAIRRKSIEKRNRNQMIKEIM